MGKDTLTPPPEGGAGEPEKKLDSMEVANSEDRTFVEQAIESGDLTDVGLARVFKGTKFDDLGLKALEQFEERFNAEPGWWVRLALFGIKNEAVAQKIIETHGEEILVAAKEDLEEGKDIRYSIGNFVMATDSSAVRAWAKECREKFR